jgi:hypothetical protein
MNANSNKLIVSIYDISEVWSGYYIRAGYPVICWDKQKEGCILENITYLMSIIEECIEEKGMQMHGFIFQPPCTEFARSGAQWWPAKDRPQPFELFDDIIFDSITQLSQALVEICLLLVDMFKPKGFWVLENPVGRIEKMVPELAPYRQMMFNPCDYGDAYTKKTVLWGNFNTNLQRNPVKPEFVIWAGKKFPKIWAGTGGKSQKTKNTRSQTAQGFAQAFFNANR